METAKKDFIELLTNSHKSHGLDDLTAKSVAILYAEPHEVSLEELAKKTGYSLSSLSTSMKMLERVGFVKRIKKPKSKKLYLYIEKDLMSTFIDMTKKKVELSLIPSIKQLPDIIAKYKKGPSDERLIVENYYQQIQRLKKIMTVQIEMMEKAQKELTK